MVTIEIFFSGSSKSYGPTFTIGNTIGCYLNFRNDDKMIFYKELQYYLSNILDDLKNNSYPCIGLRSQDASVEANFGCKKFKYLTVNNKHYNNKNNDNEEDEFSPEDALKTILEELKKIVKNNAERPTASTNLKEYKMIDFPTFFDAYNSALEELWHKVDPNNNYPKVDKIQQFVDGLRQEFQIPAQAENSINISQAVNKAKAIEVEEVLYQPIYYYLLPTNRNSLEDILNHADYSQNRNSQPQQNNSSQNNNNNNYNNNYRNNITTITDHLNKEITIV
ncbi:hypothetical protein C2G38_2230364 [Gigaspora rosea]|uniref:B30.2/SPRY domain-containing protein n=1 Tax=Gigaspora rosea TaxID=44941 RepID=A0A397TXJ1_9GLOM|nr:hypothetical protein C2G38_2230364 [Gigaspora rosea]